MKYIEELKEAIRRKDVILFVGAGVSKNLGLPTFSELIDEVPILLVMIRKYSRLYPIISLWLNSTISSGRL